MPKKYYYTIEQNFGRGFGWEEVTAETTLREAKERVAEHRDNQPEYPVRWRHVEEKKE